MPRDSTGDYTLPPANPVVPDTVIETDWANPTMTDIGNELENSLDRAGRGGMRGQLLLVDGVAAAPGLAFNLDPSSGMYRDPVDGSVFLTLGGQELMQFYLDVTDPLAPVPSINFIAATSFGATTVTFADGTQAQPGIRFTNELGSGIYRNAAGDIGMAVQQFDMWHAVLDDGVRFPWSGQGSQISMRRATSGRIARESIQSNGTFAIANGAKMNSVGDTWLAESNTVVLTSFDPSVFRVQLYSGQVIGNALTSPVEVLKADSTGVYTSGNLLATKTYVDSVAGVITAYLPLTGGTMTGPLIVNSTVSVSGALTGSSGTFSADVSCANLIASVSVGTVNETVSGYLQCTGATALKLPVGTDAQRPASPNIGDVRYNSTGGRVEVYTASGWSAQTSAGSGVGVGVRQTVSNGPIDANGLPSALQKSALVSLLHLDGTNGATTTTDANTSVTWTFTANAALSTAQQKFGSASLGSTTGNLQSTSITSLGASFTIECFMRWSTLPTAGNSHVVLAAINGSNFGVNLFFTNTSGTIKSNVFLSSNGSTHDIANGSQGVRTTYAVNTWYHVAITYDSATGKYYLYIDGVLDNSWVSALPICPITRIRLMADGSGTSVFQGFVDEFRLRSDCQYPAGTTFTPTTSAFTDIVPSLRPMLVGAATTALTITAAAGFGASGAIDTVEQISADSTDILGADLAANNTSYIYRDLGTSWTSTLTPPQYGDAFDRTRFSLMHFEGTNGSTVFLDDYGNTYTANGNAQISNAQFKFGATSLLCDGTGDFVQTNDITNLGNDSWTIECFVRWVALPGSGTKQGIMSISNASNFGLDFQIDNTAGTTKLNFYISSNGTSYDVASNALGTKTTWATGTWYHLALVYDALAGKFFAYVDGVQDWTLTSALKVCFGTKLRIGRASVSNDFNGYIDEFRLSPSCRYPNGTTFTPTVAAFAPLGHFFSIPKMQMYEITGASPAAGSDPVMTARNRVFVGEADTSSVAITSMRNYAYRGRYAAAPSAWTVGTERAFAHNIGLPSEQLVIIPTFVTTQSAPTNQTNLQYQLSQSQAMDSAGRGVDILSRGKNSISLMSNTQFALLNTANAVTGITGANSLLGCRANRAW